jgi:DNA-directed RNA polymerase subunit RPC12/RpoP
MQTTPLTCQNCGAPLDVPPTARYVTCSHCGSRLEIKRTPSAVFTEVLDRLDERTAAMADDLDAIRRDSEIERLDREWAARAAELSTRSKNGAISPPSKAGGFILIFVMGGFGLLWTIMAFAITGTGAAAVGGPFKIAACIFPAFGILFIVLAIVQGIKMLGDTSTYTTERRAYEDRRRQLLANQPRPPAS